MNFNRLSRFYIIFCSILWLWCFNAQAENALDGQVIGVVVDKKMLINKHYTATVTVKNTGVITWTKKSKITLAATSKTNSLWKIPHAELSKNEKVQPGDTKKFKMPIKALSRAGIFSLQFEMQKGNIAFGKKSKTHNIIVETRSNRVKFISQLLPNTMATGKTYPTVVQFKNNGTSTWSASSRYRLRLISKRNIWNVTHIPLNKKDIIPPGKIATFQVKLTAPNKPGNYPIQWRLQKGNTFFGEPTPAQKVRVTQNKAGEHAEFIYQNIPGLNKSGKLFSVLNAGTVYPVTLTFKNNSEKTWKYGSVSLRAKNQKNNMTWSVDRIELNKNESIKPGGLKTFNFNIISPLSPGIYYFQWQMMEGAHKNIGEKSENITVTVK